MFLRYPRDIFASFGIETQGRQGPCKLCFLNRLQQRKIVKNTSLGVCFVLSRSNTDGVPDNHFFSLYLNQQG